MAMIAPSPGPVMIATPSGPASVNLAAPVLNAEEEGAEVDLADNETELYGTDVTVFNLATTDVDTTATVRLVVSPMIFPDQNVTIATAGDVCVTCRQNEDEEVLIEAQQDVEFS